MNHATRGKTRTETHKKSIREAHIKPIIQLSLNGAFIKEWSSISDIIKCFNINSTDSNISKCCKSSKINNENCKSARGYLWVYKENYSPNILYKYKDLRFTENNITIID